MGGQRPQLRWVTGISDSLSPQIGVHRKRAAIDIRSYSWLTKRPDCATFLGGTPSVGRCVRRHIAFALSGEDPPPRYSSVCLPAGMKLAAPAMVVQLGDEVGGKHDLVMAVYDEWLHVPHPFGGLVSLGGVWVWSGPHWAGTFLVCLGRSYMSRPPLTPQTWPVMYAEASAARKWTTRAISSGWHNRPTGIWDLILSSTFSGTFSSISVAT